MDNLLNLDSPCFIFDSNEFEKSIYGFRDALARRFSLVSIGYSVKTNSLPYVLKTAKKLNCKAEVVSYDEYNLAKLCGFTPSEIIYNGPMKSYETFIEAVENGAIVNLETKRELNWLKELRNDKKYNIGIRLNINISKVSPEDADGDNDNSRFGFSNESSEFEDAIKFIRNLKNIKLKGLHIHRTAHSRSPRFYERSVEYACKIIKKYDLDLDYLDVGGGYFGIFPNKPTFYDYSDVIYSTLKNYDLEYLHIIVEPGNALTASAFSFLSEVIDVKLVDTQSLFITTDGSRNDIDPFFRKIDYIKELLYIDENRPIFHKQTIAGCTCLEYDRLFTLIDQKGLMPGDRILYKNVGAYTMTLSPLFIRFFPKVYEKDPSGNYQLIREAWGAERILY